MYIRKMSAFLNCLVMLKMILKDYEIGKYYKRVHGEETFIFRVKRVDYCLHIEPMEHIPTWVQLIHIPHSSGSFSACSGGLDTVEWETDFALEPSPSDVEAREDEITLVSLDKPDMGNVADSWYEDVFYRARSLGGRP